MFIRNEAYVTAHIPIESIPTLQRARGLLNISTQKTYQTNTRLKNLRQEGSYRASFPRHSKGNIETVIINTAGGVTSGDKFTTTITAHENSQISITTQAAERIYRARDTLMGEIQTSLCLQKNAQLYWLPQETIIFDGARLKRRLDVDLHSSAKFLMVEPLVFGREASGEKLLSGMLDDRVSISSNGQPIYIDRIKLKQNICFVFDTIGTAFAEVSASNYPIIFFDLHQRNLPDFFIEKIKERCVYIDVNKVDELSKNDIKDLLINKKFNYNALDSFSIENLKSNNDQIDVLKNYL